MTTEKPIATPQESEPKTTPKLSAIVPQSFNLSSTPHKSKWPRSPLFGPAVPAISSTGWTDQQDAQRLDTDHDRVFDPDQARTTTEVDRNLVTEISRALMEDNSTAGCVKLCEIDVSSEGVVTLSGKVTSQAVKDSFNAKAKAIAGVTRVENRCEVTAAGAEL